MFPQIDRANAAASLKAECSFCNEVSSMFGAEMFKTAARVPAKLSQFFQ